MLALRASLFSFKPNKFWAFHQNRARLPAGDPLPSFAANSKTAPASTASFFIYYKAQNNVGFFAK